MLTEKSKPDEIKQRLRRGFYREIKPLLSFPRNLNNLVREASQGELEILHNVELTKHLNTKVDKLANRLSSSLIVAGGLISTSVLLVGSQHWLAHLNDMLIFTGIGISLIGLYSLYSSIRH
ncbi:MAG: hypothetical protein NTV45_09580 [Firmicutes bacterium]|nr:hypothetical protein [Bacillota bacterium]